MWHCNHLFIECLVLLDESYRTLFKYMNAIIIYKAMFISKNNTFQSNIKSREKKSIWTNYEKTTGIKNKQTKVEGWVMEPTTQYCLLQVLSVSRKVLFSACS